MKTGYTAPGDKAYRQERHAERWQDFRQITETLRIWSTGTVKKGSVWRQSVGVNCKKSIDVCI